MGALGALTLFGHKAPGAGIGLLALALMVGVFLVSRNGGLSTTNEGRRRVGKGQMHQCKRCGCRFQPEQVELLSTGDVRRFIEDRCPKCGWDLDWGSPKSPGGASGRW